MKVRDPYIDLLRFVGLSLIILAHVTPPYVLGQLRSFDVPLMLFVSGLAASGKEIPKYWDYVWKRTKRLIVPVWLFLAVYLTIFYFTQSLFLPEKYLTGRMIWRSFLLLDESIGYVWIIRVFILVMLVTPLWVKLDSRLKNKWSFVWFVVGVFVANELIHALSQQIDNEAISVAIKDFLVYTTAYSIPFLLGLRLRRCSRKDELAISTTIMVLGVVGLVHMFIYKGLDISNSYKFPPRSYFILYGSAVSLLLWITRFSWVKILNCKFTLWVGQNTIWIYLWHMPVVLFANHFLNNWAIKYVLVYFSAVAIFLIQYKLVNKTKNKKKFANQYLIG